MAIAGDLPDEIWQLILRTITEPRDAVSLQRVSKRLLRLARDDTFWRRKCYENRPTAGRRSARRISVTVSSSQPATGSPSPPSDSNGSATDWDPSDCRENIDWYGEYIARHAPLHTIWNKSSTSHTHDISGVAVHDGSEHAVSCQEDGSILIWDIREQELGRRTFQRIAKSSPGALFATDVAPSSSTALMSRSFSGPSESIALDSRRGRAYIAHGQVLNEVDLESLQVISQQTFAWRITALSQQRISDLPLSVGTMWSLHLYDPRMTLRDRSRSPEDLMLLKPGEPEDSIAFLPNHTKDTRFRRESPDPHQSILGPYSPTFGRRGRNTERWAPVEPGPLSILNHGQYDIFLAGRFPSILSYDRRYFPRLQYVVHSGARLSSLTSIPYPPKNAGGTSSLADATLIAAGEYNGRGSLEVYSLPHEGRQPANSPPSNDPDPSTAATDMDQKIADAEQQQASPANYKNRQDAASAKILSVATQGTRIVYSDADGYIHWRERDGRGLARRWNLNDSTSKPPPLTASIHHGRRRPSNGSSTNELVARKVIPLHSPPLGFEHTADSTRDRDLLIWTGEKLGIVTTQPQYEDHEELVKAFEDKLGSGSVSEDEEREKAEEYAQAMRSALERQANERVFLARFNRWR